MIFVAEGVHRLSIRITTTAMRIPNRRKALRGQLRLRHTDAMMKRNTALLSLALFVAAPTITHAAPLNGQRCNNPGAIMRANNARFVCSPEGGRSVWRRVNGAATISSIIGALPGYSLLGAAIKQAGLDTALAGAGPFTIFAPRNAAFLALPKPTLDYLLDPANVAVLRKVLLHHVVSGSVTARTLASGTYVTLNGTTINVTVRNQIRIDGARVTFADVTATNGILHGLTGVLVPSDVSINP